MKHRLALVVIAGSLLLHLASVPARALPAFPGAEGFGADTTGGRGGSIIKVTNLNDSGSGSLRAAVMATGPRIVVFEVSGVVNLASQLTIRSPYLTIAGETSPGGICIAGFTVVLGTHDVIIRHIRFRVGSHRITDGSGADPETLDSLDIWGNTVPSTGWDAYNIVIDHCSLSWGVDETFSISYNARDITVQWSIVAEGLSQAGHPKGEHSKGLMVSGKDSAPTVSIHHNLIAKNTARNPQIGAGDKVPLVDVVNNVIYGWKGSLTMATQYTVKVNYVHNYLKRGPASNSFSFEAMHYPSVDYPEQPIIYMEGNLGLRRQSQAAEQWQVGYEYRDLYLSQGYRSTARWQAPAVHTSPMSYAVAECIVGAVGATAPARDSADTRVISNFINGDGAIVLNVTYPDDYPVYQAAAVPADADNDGMADAWEVAEGLDTRLNDSALDMDNDGYTNVEEYLHFLSDKSYAFNSVCMERETPAIKSIKVE